MMIILMANWKILIWEKLPTEMPLFLKKNTRQVLWWVMDSKIGVEYCILIYYVKRTINSGEVMSDTLKNQI